MDAQISDSRKQRESRPNVAPPHRREHGPFCSPGVSRRLLSAFDRHVRAAPLNGDPLGGYSGGRLLVS